jgi:hypothetical protein
MTLALSHDGVLTRGWGPRLPPAADASGLDDYEGHILLHTPGEEKEGDDGAAAGGAHRPAPS